MAVRNTFFLFVRDNFLSCNFTKKRPFKIFKIENFNRQMLNKITLILTK